MSIWQETVGSVSIDGFEVVNGVGDVADSWLNVGVRDWAEVIDFYVKDFIKDKAEETELVTPDRAWEG